MKKIIYEKAINLINENNTLSLSIIDSDSYPKIYAMEKVNCDKIDKIIFITKKDSNKVNSLNLNNKCCVEVHTDDDSISLKGYIEISQNDKEKMDILPYEYVQRLQRSGSDKYCVLIFNTIEADIYIDGKREIIATEKATIPKY